MLLLLGCDRGAPESDDSPTHETGGEHSATDDTSTDDTPTDSGTPEDPRADPSFDGSHVLVLTAMNRILLFDAGGGDVGGWDLQAFVADDSCDSGDCRVEGATPDGDGLLVAWARQDREGGLMRLDPAAGDLVASWVVTGWAYPHEVRTDDGPLVVADSSLDALVWVEDDGSPAPEEALAEIGTEDSDVFGAHVPNGLQVLHDGGRTWALVSYRGADPDDPGDVHGRIAMWDTTDISAPALVWTFPADGTLLAPHDPSLHWRDDRWLLLYAHSEGRVDGTGSIGVAELPDLSTPPTYLGDLSSPTQELGYPRGALLTADDALYITDTVSLRGGEGAVYVTTLPALTAPGVSGAVIASGEEQLVVPIELEPFAAGLDQPYRAFLWEPTI